MLIQLKYRGFGLRHAAGQLAAAVLCGSIVAACSGTIDTPTEENPPRSAERSAAPNRTGSTTTPRAPAPADEEEEEEEETPSEPAPGAAEDPEEPVEEEEEELPTAPAGDLSFASDIYPIFNGNCGPCHVTNGIVSNFGDPDVDQAFENSADFETQILNVIETGRMPQTCGGGEPGSAGCLSVADAAAIEAWYEAGAPE